MNNASTTCFEGFMLDITLNICSFNQLSFGKLSGHLQTNFVFLQPSAGRAKRKVAQPASPGPVLYALSQKC